MPESHLGTTPWAEHHVKVTMYAPGNKEILYSIDGNATWTRYTEEITIAEPGVHVVRAVSTEGSQGDEIAGRRSEEAEAVYKVATVAKGTAYDGYLDHCRVGLDLDSDLAIDDDDRASDRTFMDSFGRAFFKVSTLKGLRAGYVLLVLDHPSQCVCGIPMPNCCCDKSVGIPQMLYLRTPANATQLNPVTTILSQIAEDHTADTGATIDGAQALLKSAWALPSAYDIVSDDILWLSLNPYLDIRGKGPQSLVIMAQAEVMACLVAMALAGARGLEWPTDEVATAVYASMAQETVQAHREGTPINFTSPDLCRRAASGAAERVGLVLDPLAIEVTSQIVAKLSVSLLSLLATHEETKDIAEFSLPVEIAAVSRDANTEIGRDVNRVASRELEPAAFESRWILPPAPAQNTIAPVLPTKEEGGEGEDQGSQGQSSTAMATKPQGRGATWQVVLIGGVGAPLVLFAAFYAVKRKQGAKKEQLLNLVERHNLLGGHNLGSSGSGDGSAGADHQVISVRETRLGPAMADRKAKAKAKAPDFSDVGSDAAFGTSFRIRHRPPKPTKLERQTLLFDHQRATWHTPTDLPQPPTPEISPRSPGPQILHAIEEDDRDGPEPTLDQNPLAQAGRGAKGRGHGSSSAMAAKPGTPQTPAPPPLNPNVFVRRTKLYKPK